MNQQDKTKQELNKSLDIQDDELLPFIPFLLKDLWALGGQPEIVLDLLKRNGLLDREPGVLDLGCGKGATIIHLAEFYNGTFTGVDIVKEFIEEGQERIKSSSLKGTVDLITADINTYCAEQKKFYDLVIFGYDMGILGDELESLNRISKLLKPDGKIVFETAFSLEGEHVEECKSLNVLTSMLERDGFDIIDQTIWPRSTIIEMNAEYNTKIKKRVEELSLKHPEKAQLFNAYMSNQIEESKLLDNKLGCISMLLSR